MRCFAFSKNNQPSAARHLTADPNPEELILGKGVVTKWERIRKKSHWFDALYNACAAGHYAGVRLITAEKNASPSKQRMTLSQLRDQKRETRDVWFGERERYLSSWGY